MLECLGREEEFDELSLLVGGEGVGRSVNRESNVDLLFGIVVEDQLQLRSEAIAPTTALKLTMLATSSPFPSLFRIVSVPRILAVSSPPSMASW